MAVYEYLVKWDGRREEYFKAVDTVLFSVIAFADRAFAFTQAAWMTRVHTTYAGTQSDFVGFTKKVAWGKCWLELPLWNDKNYLEVKGVDDEGFLRALWNWIV